MPNKRESCNPKTKQFRNRWKWLNNHFLKTFGIIIPLIANLCMKHFLCKESVETANHQKMDDQQVYWQNPKWPLHQSADKRVLPVTMTPTTTTAFAGYRSPVFRIGHRLGGNRPSKGGDCFLKVMEVLVMKICHSLWLQKI